MDLKLWVKALKNMSNILFIASIVSFFVVFSNVNLETVIGTDFVNHYVGASIVKNGDGSLLYDVDYNRKIQKSVLNSPGIFNIAIIRLLPFGVFFLLPLTFFPILTAYKIFVFINLLILALITYVAKKTFSNIKLSYRALFLLLICFLPVLKAIVMGQLSLLYTLLLLVTYIYFKKKKYFVAGVVAAILSAKIQFILFYPFLFILSKDRKKFVSGVVAGGMCLLLLSIIVSGFGWIRVYPEYLLGTESVLFGSWPHQMWTFTGFLSTVSVFFREHFIYAAVINAILFFIVMLIFVDSRRKLGFNLVFSTIVIFSLFFSTHLYDHDLTLLVVVLFIFMNKAFTLTRSTNRPYVITFLILYFLPLVAGRIGPGILSLALFTSGLVILSDHFFPFSAGPNKYILKS
jgi:hypothetical protein